MKEAIQFITKLRSVKYLMPGEIFIKDKKLWISINTTDSGYLVKSIPAGECEEIPICDIIKIVTEASCISET